MLPITFTPAAQEHIKTMLAKNAQSIGFRLSVKKTGCSGLSYVATIIEEAVKDDIHFRADDLPVFVDPNAIQYLENLQIDFVVETLQGLPQKRLIFINPKETGRCGCGESFTVE